MFAYSLEGTICDSLIAVLRSDRVRARALRFGIAGETMIKSRTEIHRDEIDALRDFAARIDSRGEETSKGSLGNVIECPEDVRRMSRAALRRTARRCKSACAHDQTDLLSLELLAQCLWHLEEHTQVVETTQKLLRMNAFEPGYLLLQGMSNWALGRTGVAMFDLRRALRASSSPCFRSNVTEAIQGLDRFQSEMVESLLHMDRPFVQRYKADPRAACRERGFEFSWHERPDTLPPPLAIDVLGTALGERM